MGITEQETLREFYYHWNEKVAECNTNNLSDNFDKFFSQFVIFNRLYLEVAKILVKENPEIDRRFGITKRRTFALSGQKAITRPNLPDDKWCATTGIKEYCKHSSFSKLIFVRCQLELKTIRLIIKNRELYFYEDYLTNSPLWDKDLQIYKRIAEKDIMAVLELIYVVRCNLFHGEKDYSQAQIPLFQSINFILSIINQHIFNTLMSDNRF